MFTIDGLSEFEAYVREKATTLRTDIQTEVAGIMKPETDKIRNDAPYRTGKLRRSHKFVLGGGKGILCQIRIEAEHAGFVNFGTSRMAARPFATNGYNRIKSRLRQITRRA